jgi:hypothetical protein
MARHNGGAEAIVRTCGKIQNLSLTSERKFRAEVALARATIFSKH